MTPSLTLVRPESSPPAELTAQRVWRMCAPALASDRVRVSRDNGRTYPRSTERPLTDRLPAQPAAVRIYDADGTTRCFVADFDAKQPHHRQKVAEQSEAFADLVRRCGGRVVIDTSPSGGRHVYVPLADPLPWAHARALAVALAQRYSTMDKMPMMGLDSGLIRPPGSRHPSGGFQELVTDDAAAQHALSARTPAEAVRRLCLAVDVDPDAPAPTLAPVPSDLWRSALDLPPITDRRRRLAPEWELMAVDGTWPSQWPSPSEARLAFLRACARHGWVFADVVERFESGQWPGLRRLYDRYGPHHVRSSLARDWHKAATTQDLTRQPADTPRMRTARNSNMKVPPTHAPTQAHHFIRDWWNVITHIEPHRWKGRGALTIRRVLRAIGAAAQMAGSTRISFGVRSLALASGIDHTTVADRLKVLREEDDPLIVRVQQAEALDADVYELRIPDAHESLTQIAWKPGIIRRIHPLFRVLGGGAFLVWEVLQEAGGQAVSTFDIALKSALPVRTTQESLRELAALGLVEQTGPGWVATGDLEAAAEETGATDLHRAVFAEHLRDREVWRELVAAWAGQALARRRWWTEEPPDWLEAG